MTDLNKAIEVTKPKRLKQDVYHIDMSKYPALNIWLRDLAKRHECSISHVVRTLLIRSMRSEVGFRDRLPKGIKSE